MSRKKEQSWTEIARDSWLLGTESWMVIGLRVARLAGGGEKACSEAQLMVSEKIASSQDLVGALAAGQLGTNPKAVLGNTVAHYLHGVRANRKRLSRR